MQMKGNKKYGREKSKVVVDNINDDEMVEKLESEHSDLSYKAMGVLFFLRAKGEGWYFDLKDLYNKFGDGRKAVKGGIDELEKHGILRKQRYEGDFKQGYKWILTL